MSREGRCDSNRALLGFGASGACRCCFQRVDQCVGAGEFAWPQGNLVLLPTCRYASPTVDGSRGTVGGGRRDPWLHVTIMKTPPMHRGPSRSTVNGCTASVGKCRVSTVVYTAKNRLTSLLREGCAMNSLSVRCMARSVHPPPWQRNGHAESENALSLESFELRPCPKFCAPGVPPSLHHHHLDSSHLSCANCTIAISSASRLHRRPPLDLAATLGATASPSRQSVVPQLSQRADRLPA